MRFPDAVERELLRALGAYLRTAPVSELPPSIRRFRTFRQAALRPHRDRLWQALGEEADLRAAILEWLDEVKPRLGKGEERVLRIVAERADGWEEQLTGGPTPGPESSPSEPAPVVARSAAAEHDHKAEARRLRGQLRAAAREHAAARGELTRQVEELRSRAEVAETAARDAVAAAAAAGQGLQREVRRLQRAAEKTRAERDRAVSEAKALRREVKAQAQRADAAQQARRPSRGTTKSASVQDGRGAGKKRRVIASSARRALPTPQGLLEDDPLTLVHWLGEPSVRLLVDGYNVAMQEGAFKSLSTEDQRARTVDEVARFVRRHEVPATVVFDGADVAPGTSRRRRSPVKVEYSRPPESADDHLVALLASWPPDPVVVATSDKALQGRCRALGSTIASSEQLLAALR